MSTARVATVLAPGTGLTESTWPVTKSSSSVKTKTVPSCAGELLLPVVNFRARSTRQQKVTIDRISPVMVITDQVAMAVLTPITEAMGKGQAMVDNTHAVASLAVMVATMADRHTVAAMTGTISMIAMVDK